MSKHLEMKALIEELNQASDAYYNGGHTIMTDAEWDQKYESLKKLESETGVVFSDSPTHRVGYEIRDAVKKVQHNHPMLSLDKAHTVEELEEFSNGQNCWVSIKLDGLTTSLRYLDGKLVSAETRGDGEIGVDCLHNAMTVTNIPKEIPYKEELIIDGEMIIDYRTFHQINDKLEQDKKFKNSRNLVSGTLQMLDSKIASERRMQFVAWRIIKGFDQYDSVTKRLCMVRDLGFTIVPFWEYPVGCNCLPEILQSVRDEATNLGYPYDGAVMGYISNSYGESLGRTEKFFRYSIAYKYEDALVKTQIRHIESTMGKTGVLTPTAVFDPVEMGGTTVTKASLHNITIMKNLKLSYGDKIVVYKANQIIPQVADNLDRSLHHPIVPPKICLCCGSGTKIVKENDTEVLICTNPNCKGKLLGKLSNFVSRGKMNIDGLSEANLKKFIDANMLETYSDIYELDRFQYVIQMMPGFGEKSVQKLLDSIERSREVTLNRFLAALSIPGIGDKTAKDIAKAMHNNIEEFNQAVADRYDFSQISGIGYVVNTQIYRWFDDMKNRLDYQKLLEHLHFPENQPSESSSALSGKIFCITGTISHYKNRKALQEEIERFGGKTTGSVTTKTSYLINNDKNSNSSKNKKAKELGIPIISEEEFLKMIKEK